MCNKEVSIRSIQFYFVLLCSCSATLIEYWPVARIRYLNHFNCCDWIRIKNAYGVTRMDMRSVVCMEKFNNRMKYFWNNNFVWNWIEVVSFLAHSIIWKQLKTKLNTWIYKWKSMIYSIKNVNLSFFFSQLKFPFIIFSHILPLMFEYQAFATVKLEYR